MSLPTRLIRPALALGALLAVPAAAAFAQEIVDRPAPPVRFSHFDLRGEGDIARTSMRMQGEWMMYNINTGPADDFGGPGYSFFGLLGTRARPGGIVFQFFGMGSPYAGAPRGEWLRHLEAVPSLANALPKGEAQGWTSVLNLTSFGEPRQFNAADGQFGRAYSGLESTVDGSCLDHSQVRGGYLLDAGWPLLAGSNCPPTWPRVDGVPTFLGSHPIPGDSWEEIFQSPEVVGMSGDNFEFSWWRVSDEYQDRSRFFGDFATYGAYNDFNATTRAKFGNVVPDQSGDPLLTGWPMGLEFSYDAFSYALPTLQNVSFWRATLVNKSRELYGVGLDYDSLYIGFAYEHGRTQASSVYFDPVRNTIWSTEIGASGSPTCNDARPIGTLGCLQRGFDFGATATVVLKSPIGDTRNKLFTDPQSPFYDPTNPYRGDTITFNHGKLCDYGNCFVALGGLTGNPRKLFGFYSSSHQNLLYDRQLEEFSATRQAIAFRNPFFPEQVVPFAHTVPGHGVGGLQNPAPEWNYTRRPASAPAGPDTLWFDNCGPAGCSVVWSDTMAAPGRYVNRAANNGMWGIGPFRLAADDTVGLVLAMIGAPDSAALEGYVANTIEFYNKFYLGPSAAPPVRVVASQVDGVNRIGAEAAFVTLFLNDTLETHVDVFLSDFAAKMEVAGPGTREYRLRQLNPGLVDRIRERAVDNIDRLFIFKSCDGGRTFTATSDCRGDPARDITGSAIGVGWRAYGELTRTETGFPNVFRDNNVLAGRSYLYVLVAETKGASFAVVDSVDTNGDGALDGLVPTELNIAPRILNSLATSTSDPNVASVYVPAGQQAGSRQPAFSVTADAAGPTSLPFSATRAGDVSGGRFRAVFGSRLTVTRLLDAANGALQSAEVVVADVGPAVRDPGTAGEQTIDDHVFSSTTYQTSDAAGVTLNGPFSLESQETQGGLTTEVWVLDRLGFVLVDQDGNEPLLATGVLEPDRTTPGAFFNRPDYPGFLVSADNRSAGGFVEQVYTTPDGEALLNRVRPWLLWNERTAAVAAAADQLGEYVVEWTAKAFGPGSPFRLNRLNPEETRQAVAASLQGRAAGTTGVVNPETVELLRSALGQPDLEAADLVAARLPFRVRNGTMDRDVEIAVLKRSDPTILLGTGGDTLRIEVPEAEWVPGDRMVFIETATLDSLVDDRRVVDASGGAVTVTRRIATLVDASVDCGTQPPRLTCNPVVGTGQSDFLDADAGVLLHAVYGNPFDARTAFTIDVTPSLAGGEILTSGEIGSLDAVNVVPNPYLMLSRYETSPQERRIMFNNLPPRGEIRIYTVTGEFVQEIRWTEQDVGATGDLFYNLRTHEGNELASGLYVFRVQATDPASGQVRSKVGKFVIIR